MTQFDFMNQEEQVEEFVEEQQQLDQELSEAERRFEKAQYYRVLLRESFFDNDTPEAIEVVEEIRQFIRDQMGILLGIKQEPIKTESVFSEDEVAILKQLTSKFLKKPQLMDTPQVKQAQQPQQPVLKKAVVSQPQVKKVSTPQQKQQPKSKKTGKIQEKQTPQGTLKFNEDTGEIVNVMTTSDGKQVVQNITPQARPTGSIQPLPPLNEQTMAIIASRHESESRKGATKSIMDKIST